MVSGIYNAMVSVVLRMVLTPTVSAILSNWLLPLFNVSLTVSGMRIGGVSASVRPLSVTTSPTAPTTVPIA